jgi:Zn-dependent protease
MSRPRPSSRRLFEKGGRFRVDLLSIVLLIPLFWTLGAVLFPILAPELPVNNYWWMAAAALLGLALSHLLRAIALLVVARPLQLELSGLTFYLFGPVAHTRLDPRQAGAEAILSLTHIFAGLFVGVVWMFIFALGFGDHPPVAVIGVAFFLALTNLGLTAAYLLPAYPLEGGRVLWAIVIAWKKESAKAVRAAVAISWIVVLALLAAGAAALIITDNIPGAIWTIIGALVLAAAAFAGSREQRADTR